MAQAYVGLDDVYTYFLWDQEALSLLDKDGYYKTVEVPDELIAEYKALSKAMDTMNDKLKALYGERRKTPIPV